MRFGTHKQDSNSKANLNSNSSSNSNRSRNSNTNSDSNSRLILYKQVTAGQRAGRLLGTTADALAVSDRNGDVRVGVFFSFFFCGEGRFRGRKEERLTSRKMWDLGSGYANR